VSAPTPPSILPAYGSGDSVPACDVCGRQDETLRLAGFPYVFSLLIMTWRRSFAGVWCRKHRNRYRFLAGLISPLVGWFGFPFGIIRTPMVLFQMARGGIQPRDENQRLLHMLSGHKLRVGDAEGAIRCLEQALRLNDDEAARQRLRALYDEHRPATYRESPPRFWPILVALLGAAALGVAIGLADYGITAGLETIFGAEGNILVALLTWTPWITLLFLGGLALFQILQWAIERCACRQMALGITLAVLSVLVTLYGTQQGYTLADLIKVGLSGGLLGSLGQDLLLTWFVWSAGGALTFADTLQSGGASGVIYLVIFVVAIGYYLVVALRAARGTVHWQQVLAAVRAWGAPSPVRALRSGWLAIAIIFVCITGSLISAPIAAYLSNLIAGTESLQEAAQLGGEGRMDEAIAELEVLVEENPDVSVYHSILGMFYGTRGEYDRSAKELELALDLAPDDALSHAYLAVTYYLQDQQARAGQELARAEALGADDGLAQQVLGRAYILMHDLERAEEKLRYAVEQAPDDPRARLELARLYSLQNRPEESLESLDRALELDPGLVEAQVARGYVHLRQADFDKAAEAFDQALGDSPEDPSVHSALSLLHYLQGDLVAARQEAEDALAINRYEQDAHCHLALACQAAGDLEQGLTAAREAVRLGPKDDLAHYALGLCYRDLGQDAEAIQAFETFLDLYWDRVYTRDWKAEAEGYVAAHR
jgi:tetratricopeptide (TPR) repeat protein